MTFALAGLAGMLLMALLDGEWARWRARRATYRPAPNLRLVLGAQPQPTVVRVIPPVYDWRKDGL